MTMEMKGNCYTLSVAIGMLAVFGKLPGHWNRSVDRHAGRGRG